MEGSKLNWQMKPDSCCHISGVLDLKSSQGCFDTVLCLHFPVVLENPLERKQQIIQYRNRSSEGLKKLRCTVQNFAAKPNLAVRSCFLWMIFSIASYKLAYHAGNPRVNSTSGTKCASGCPFTIYPFTISTAFYQALLTCPALSFLCAQVLFQTFSLFLPASSPWRLFRLFLGIPVCSWVLHCLKIGLHCGI